VAIFHKRVTVGDILLAARRLPTAHSPVPGSAAFGGADDAIAQNGATIGPVEKQTGDNIFDPPFPSRPFASVSGGIGLPKGSPEAAHDMFADIEDLDVTKALIHELPQILVPMHDIGLRDM
jgi:hypothetical protein